MGLWWFCGCGWTRFFARLLIRPTRSTYRIPEDLGPERFVLESRVFTRTRVVLYNEAGLKLEGSLYEPLQSDRATEKLPCVVYAHGNAGSQMDGIEVAAVCLPFGLAVFTFDFSGSGMSEGEWVTLGWKEADDLDKVIEWLKRDGRVGEIAVWGRSMGAVTALLHGQRCEQGTFRGDHRPAAYVLDSPFSDLRRLVKDVVNSYRSLCLPSCVVGYTRQEARRYVKRKIGGDIFTVDTSKAAATCRSPALLASGVKDELVGPDHVTRLYEAYAGDKCLVEFPTGDHNSERPAQFYDTAVVFLLNALCPLESGMPALQGAGGRLMRDRSTAVPAACRLLGAAVPWAKAHASLSDRAPPSWVSRHGDERDRIALAQAQSRGVIADPEENEAATVVPLSVLADAHDRKRAEDDGVSPLRVWAEYKREVTPAAQARSGLSERLFRRDIASEVSSPVEPSPFRHSRPGSPVFPAAPPADSPTSDLPGAAVGGSSASPYGQRGGMNGALVESGAHERWPIQSPLADATNVHHLGYPRRQPRKKLTYSPV